MEPQEARSYLTKIYNLKKNIKRQKTKLGKMESASLSIHNNDDIGKQCPEDQLARSEKMAIAIAEKRAEIHDATTGWMNAAISALDIIAVIPDPLHRTLLIERYINCTTIKEAFSFLDINPSGGYAKKILHDAEKAFAEAEEIVMNDTTMQ